MDELTARLRAAGCVFAEDEAMLLLAAEPGGVRREPLVLRRLAGEPLETVLGWAEFCGLRITVRPGVFVPRRRTELLARQAVSLAGRSAVVVELCCGSGAISAVVLAARPSVTLYAADLDENETRCAADNLGTRASIFHGDLYEPLPSRLRGTVDVLVANAPYVPTGEIASMPTDARDHEPRMALDGGPDGLRVLRRVISYAPQWLRPGGHLLFETSRRQAPPAITALTAAGLTGRVIVDDEIGGTVLHGRRPAAREAGQESR